MDDKALEALHVAADAIRKMKGVTDVSAENDHNSGELFFTVASSGREYKLVLKRG